MTDRTWWVLRDGEFFIFSVKELPSGELFTQVNQSIDDALRFASREEADALAWRLNERFTSSAPYQVEGFAEDTFTTRDRSWEVKGIFTRRTLGLPRLLAESILSDDIYLLVSYEEVRDAFRKALLQILQHASTSIIHFEYRGYILLLFAVARSQGKLAQAHADFPSAVRLLRIDLNEQRYHKRFNKLVDPED